MRGVGWQTLSLSLGLVLAILNKVAPQACPAQCSCSGSTVDCHGLALRSVPRNIPRSTERLWVWALPPPSSLPSGSRSPCVETGGTERHRELCLGQSSLAFRKAHPGLELSGRALPGEGPLPKEGRARWLLRLVPSSRSSPDTRSPLRASSVRLGRRGDGGRIVADAWGKGDATLFLGLCKRSHLAVGNCRGSVQGRVPALVIAGWREEGGLTREGGYSKERNLRSPALCRPPGDWGRGDGVVGWLSPPRGASTGRGRKDAPGRQQLSRWPRAAPSDSSPAFHFPWEEAAAAASPKDLSEGGSSGDGPRPVG